LTGRWNSIEREMRSFRLEEEKHLIEVQSEKDIED